MDRPYSGLRVVDFSTTIAGGAVIFVASVWIARSEARRSAALAAARAKEAKEAKEAAAKAVAAQTPTR